MSNKMHENTQQTNAVSTPSKNLQCQSCYEVGLCNECWYYSTHCGKGWCDKEHHPIENSNCYKDCFVR